MSKEIKITIVTGNGKVYMETKGKCGGYIVLTHNPALTVMSTLLENRVIDGSFCGGRGDCGRCRIQFLKGGPLPTAVERGVMDAEELRQGYRLACLARPKDDCVIRLAMTKERDIPILSYMIDVPENNDQSSQLENRSLNRKASVADTTYDEEIAGVMIAVDLGTTTVVMQLMELRTGRTLDTFCIMNPQRRYGSDVLSRIRASCDGQREELQRLIRSVLEQGVKRFKARTANIKGMCIAGNTTMEHLLMGYNVLSLGASPFTPVEIGLQEYRHPDWSFPVWLTPGVSAFVGGDLVAGLYALGLLPGNNLRGTALLIDLGTNGEMAITDGSRTIVTATAAGPAFEGGAGAGIVGSDMIANIAALLQKGILDETGLLEEPYFTEGIRVGEPAVRMSNRDIRDLQMAKAAVRAGTEILWRHMGRPEITHVYLAGGFGYYLDVEAAFRIGLLPEHMRGRVSAVGNTSLAGAYYIGRDLLNGRTRKDELEKQLSSIVSINLAEQAEFEDLYVRSMNLRADDFS